MLWLTAHRPVCSGIKHPSGAYDQILITVRQLWVCWFGALPDERMGLSFRIAAGPRQCSHCRVWVRWDSRPHFTVSDWRLPFSSPPMTCSVTVEVFDPASTWEWHQHRVKSYVTTHNQSASLSWNKAPIWGLQSDFYCCQTVTGIAGLLMWGAFSHEWMGLSFTIAAGTRQCSQSLVRDFPFRCLQWLAGLQWKWHQNHHNMGFINQARHIPPVRVKKNIKKLHTHMRSSTHVHELFYGYCCWN
jgi:hypothetical protein